MKHRNAPLRRVVDIVSETRWTPHAGNVTDDFELLECGHRRAPQFNAHFGGTDIGQRKSRRCDACVTEGTIEREQCGAFGTATGRRCVLVADHGGEHVLEGGA
jgi:hypothetical protein